jgi:hypothetical protein
MAITAATHQLLTDRTLRRLETAQSYLYESLLCLHCLYCLLYHLDLLDRLGLLGLLGLLELPYPLLLLAHLRLFALLWPL